MNGNFTPSEKIQLARIRLQEKYPFFSFLAMQMDVHEAPKITPTMCVDFKGNLYYNPEFIEKLDKHQLLFAICHEVLHLGLEHLTRKGDRGIKKWNVACDYAVNAICKEQGLNPPEMVLYDEKYENMSVEEIYRNLPDNFSNSSFCDGNCDECDKRFKRFDDINPYDDDYVICRKGFDDHKHGDPRASEEARQAEKKWQDKLVEAAEYARQQGKMPGGIEELIDDLYEEKIDWKSELRKYVRSFIQSDYTWMKPAKKSQAVGEYLPATKMEQIDVVVTFDTSLSINHDEMVQFKSEIFSMLRSYKNIKITVIMHDSEVQETYTLGRGGRHSIEQMKAVGRGGTDHIPVFEWISNNIRNPKCVICLTDGYTSMPNRWDESSVVWAINNEDNFEPNFGKVIRII
ncbi:MAG: DUF2201 family putative metallopeptidase [Petrotogales bacterium]